MAAGVMVRMGLTLGRDTSCALPTLCAQILDFNNSTVGENVGILFALFWGYLLAAFVALWAAVRRQT